MGLVVVVVVGGGGGHCGMLFRLNVIQIVVTNEVGKWE
jgi:hypothetical protein